MFAFKCKYIKIIQAQFFCDPKTEKQIIKIFCFVLNKQKLFNLCQINSIVFYLLLLFVQLKQLILSGNLLCSKDDAAHLAGIQLRIQETAPVHPSALGSTVSSTLATNAKTSGGSVTDFTANGSTSGIITGLGSALGLSTSELNQMALSSGSADRNAAVGAKLRPICEDSKVEHKFILHKVL